ncbi:hypothetical protein PR002_g2432 [Phytophthora rubi]|uniref:Uncharacterized protein n=1 Tax=Phytophthora rubi TaxID=129364 RepID=A0A6A3NXD4_9STRA|nr:hypothetical protein PR002_g2432 [Phytophthora rubi]
MRITLDGVVLTIKDVMLNGRLLQHHFASSIAGRPINTIKHAELRRSSSKSDKSDKNAASDVAKDEAADVACPTEDLEPVRSQLHVFLASPASSAELFLAASPNSTTSRSFRFLLEKR